MRTLCLIMAALFYVSAPNMASAEGSHKFSVKGYDLSFTWKHKTNETHQDIFEINGNATKGTPCKKLEIQVAFSNDHYKDYVPVAKAIIDNYKPDTKSEFRGETVVKTESKHVPSWGVVDYMVKCLE